MEKTKWVIRNIAGFPTIVEEDSTQLKRICIMADVSGDEMEKNARMISAVPEMVEFLRYMKIKGGLGFKIHGQIDHFLNLIDNG